MCSFLKIFLLFILYITKKDTKLILSTPFQKICIHFWKISLFGNPNCIGTVRIQLFLNKSLPPKSCQWNFWMAFSPGPICTFLWDWKFLPCIFGISEIDSIHASTSLKPAIGPIYDLTFQIFHTFHHRWRYFPLCKVHSNIQIHVQKTIYFVLFFNSSYYIAILAKTLNKTRNLSTT